MPWFIACVAVPHRLPDNECVWFVGRPPTPPVGIGRGLRVAFREMWRRKKPEFTKPEDEFAEEMLAVVQQVLGTKPARIPNFALSIERPDGPPITMNLSSLYAETKKLTGEERVERLRTAALAAAPPPRPATWIEAAPSLLPSVRAVSWVEASEAAKLIHEGLVPFLKVTCAIDSEHATSYVTRSDLASWGQSAEASLRAATANMGKLQLQVAKTGSAAIVLGPDGYVSSWLIAPARLRETAREFGEEMVALAPHRDRLLLVDATDVAASIRLMEETLLEYQNAPRHLSPVPYLVKELAIEPWSPPADHPARKLVDKAKHVLANVEYGLQKARLTEFYAKAGQDVFVASYSLVQRPDGSVWSWAAWSKQVTAGLLPEVDVLLLVDNANREGAFAVRWQDAVALAGRSLKQDAAADPPRWRHTGWPDTSTLTALQQAAIPFPPPAG